MSHVNLDGEPSGLTIPFDHQALPAGVHNLGRSRGNPLGGQTAWSWRAFELSQLAAKVAPSADGLFSALFLLR
jgi:hypothetical protein